jgi:hypothetical protein
MNLLENSRDKQAYLTQISLRVVEENREMVLNILSVEDLFGNTRKTLKYIKGYGELCLL